MIGTTLMAIHVLGQMPWHACLSFICHVIYCPSTAVKHRCTLWILFSTFIWSFCLNSMDAKVMCCCLHWQHGHLQQECEFVKSSSIHLTVNVTLRLPQCALSLTLDGVFFHRFHHTCSLSAHQHTSRSFPAISHSIKSPARQYLACCFQQDRIEEPHSNPVRCTAFGSILHLFQRCPTSCGGV